MFSPKETVLRAISHQVVDRVPHAYDGSCRFVNHRGRKPPHAGVDEWGVEWQPLPASYDVGDEEPADSYPARHPAGSCQDLLDVRFPRGDDPALFDGLLDGLDGEYHLLIGQHPAGVLDRFSSLLGMRAAMLALASEPECTATVLARIADYHEAIARGYVASGVGAGWLADDFAGHEGPFIRPATWRTLILPHLAKIIAVYRDAALPLFFHTCGRAELFVPDLIDAGVTVFNLQSSLCDLPGLQARFGHRISFYGGVPSDLMMAGRPEQVIQGTRSAIELLARDGGLILAPDQPLNFPGENRQAFIETAERCGILPYWRRASTV